MRRKNRQHTISFLERKCPGFYKVWKIAAPILILMLLAAITWLILRWQDAIPGIFRQTLTFFLTYPYGFVHYILFAINVIGIVYGIVLLISNLEIFHKRKSGRNIPNYIRMQEFHDKQERGRKRKMSKRFVATAEVYSLTALAALMLWEQSVMWVYLITLVLIYLLHYCTYWNPPMREWWEIWVPAVISLVPILFFAFHVILYWILHFTVTYFAPDISPALLERVQKIFYFMPLVMSLALQMQSIPCFDVPVITPKTFNKVNFLIRQMDYRGYQRCIMWPMITASIIFCFIFVILVI